MTLQVNTSTRLSRAARRFYRGDWAEVDPRSVGGTLAIVSMWFLYYIGSVVWDLRHFWWS